MKWSEISFLILCINVLSFRDILQWNSGSRHNNGIQFLVQIVEQLWQFLTHVQKNSSWHLNTCCLETTTCFYYIIKFGKLLNHELNFPVWSLLTFKTASTFSIADECRRNKVQVKNETFIYDIWFCASRIVKFLCMRI